MVWPNTHIKAHMPSNQQLEKQAAEEKRQQEMAERVDRRRRQDFSRSTHMPTGRRGSGSTVFTTTTTATDSIYSRYRRISQSEDTDQEGHGTNHEEEQDDIPSDGDDAVYSDDDQTEAGHRPTWQHSVLLQSPMHSSALSQHYSSLSGRQGSPRSISQQPRQPYIPSPEQTRTNDMPSTMPLTYTIPSAQPKSSDPFSSSSSHHFTPSSSSDHFALQGTSAVLPSPPRSQKSPGSSDSDFQSQPLQSLDSSKPPDRQSQRHIQKQKVRQRMEPENIQSPPTASSPSQIFHHAYGTSPSDSQATSPFTQQELEELADELDSSQDPIAQQRARKGTEDISDPRLKIPHKAYAQRGGMPSRLAGGGSTQASSDSSPAVGATNKGHSDDDNNDGEAKDTSTLYDSVVDGIARMEVTMDLDGAGRWRIKRTDTGSGV